MVLWLSAGAWAAPMSTANRTSGVAPLAVFFDAVGANPVIPSAMTPQPYGYADLHFEWSFGDDPSAIWANTGRSKDEAIGFVAGHIYENPGTYVATLRVTLPDGSVQSFEQTITVSDPNVVYANSSNDTAERTWYVSTSLGSNSNIGSFNRPYRTLEYGLSRIFNGSGPRRLLIRRGEAYPGGDGIYVANRTGPYTIGAYGAGADPVITFNASTNGASLQFSATTSDVRVMDLDIVGPTIGHAITPGVNTLILRTDITGAGSGVSTSGLNGNKAGSFVVDSVITDSDNYAVYYNFGGNVAVMGNVFDTVFQEHVMRCYLTHSVIQHNTFRGGANAKHQLKFVGYSPTGDPNRDDGIPTEEVEYSIISDNLFEQSGPIAWMITIGPTDQSTDQRLSNVVFERNVVRAGLSAAAMVYLNNRLVTIRNNVFDATGSTTTVAGIRVTRRGIEPPPTQQRILHNTIYQGGPLELVGVQVDSMAQSTVVRNNLMGGENVVIISGQGTGLQAERNLRYCDAGFVDPDRGDFELLPTSPAIDRGALVPAVFTDYSGVVRPIDGDASGRAERDVGAYEYSPLRNLKRRASGSSDVR